MTKKRGQNEGTIYRRTDGRWAATISLGYRNQRRHRKTFYGKTKAEVHHKLVEAQRNEQLGLNVAPARITVAQFLHQWLEEIVKPKARPSTYRSYEQICRNHLVPALGKTQLSKLSVVQVQSFLNQRSKDGISSEHLRRVLRAALAKAERWDLVPRNVCRLADAPSRPKRKSVFLTQDQAKAFMGAIAGHRLEGLFKLTLALGLRLGEVAGLRWSDVDFEAGTLSVSAQLQRVEGKLRHVDLKTTRSRRTLPLPAFVVESLRKHKSRQAEEKLWNIDRWQEQGLVFTSTIGTPVDLRNVRRSLAEVLKKADLPPMRFHDLRHSAASLMLAAGADLRLIMETLGHSQIAVTADLYTHVAPQLQRGIADRMDAMLSSA